MQGSKNTFRSSYPFKYHPNTNVGEESCVLSARSKKSKKPIKHQFQSSDEKGL